MDEVKISVLFGIMLYFVCGVFWNYAFIYYYYAFVYGLFCVLFAIIQCLILINLCFDAQMFLINSHII